LSFGTGRERKKRSRDGGRLQGSECCMPLATDSIEMVMLRAPSGQGVGIRVGMWGVIPNAVAAGVTHTNDVVWDAHDHITGVPRDFDVTPGMQSGLELTGLDPPCLVFTKERGIVVRITHDGAWRIGAGGRSRGRD